MHVTYQGILVCNDTCAVTIIFGHIGISLWGRIDCTTIARELVVPTTKSSQNLSIGVIDLHPRILKLLNYATLNHWPRSYLHCSVEHSSTNH